MTIIFLIYFLVTNTLGDYLNFCFGGLLEFGSENVRMHMPRIYYAFLVILTMSIGLIHDTKDKPMIIVTAYELGLCLLIYPLTNLYHWTLGLVLVLPMLVILLEKVVSNDNLYSLMVALSVLFLRFVGVTDKGESIILLTEDIVTTWPVGLQCYAEIVGSIVCVLIMAFGLSIALSKDKIFKVATYLSCIMMALFAGRIYFETMQEQVVPKGLEIYDGVMVTNESLQYIKNVEDYIAKKESEGYEVYVVSADASYFMAPLNRNNYKYDLILYGSLGYKGEERLIEDTDKLVHDSKKKVLLLKAKELMHQEPVKFDKYIKSTYQQVDEIENMIAYEYVSQF